MNRRLARGLVSGVMVTLVWCAAPTSLGAAPRALIRKVKSGETAAKLALRYYGKPFAERILLLANGLDGLARDPPELKEGATIRLPTAWSYRIRPGDTFAGLAQDYLGDKRQAGFLAWVNGKDGSRPTVAGHVIIVPALVKVKVPRRWKLSKLAARLLNQKPKSEAVKRLVRRIRKYNGLRSIGRRRSLMVPLIRLRVLGWFLPSGLPDGDPGSVRRSLARLRQAQQDLQAGRYVEVLVGLAPLARVPGLTPTLRVRAHHLRCTAYVALARSGLALSAARAVLRLDPGFKPDPVQISPKVRAVYRRAAADRGAPGRKKAGN